jgi:outer membrane protein
MERRSTTPSTTRLPTRAFGFNLTIPIGNKYAQSVQARSLMEYRQAELRLEQLYTQIRMQVVNAQFALIQRPGAGSGLHRRQGLSAAERRRGNQEAAPGRFDLCQCSACRKSNLATAENNLIAANAAYAKDRAGLYQTLATTLQHYGINLNEAATGDVKTTPVVPGVSPAKNTSEPSTTPAASK